MPTSKSFQRSPRSIFHRRRCPYPAAIALITPLNAYTCPHFVKRYVLPSISSAACVMPCLSPPVKMNRNGLSSASTLMCALAVKPPTLLPSACDFCPPFYAPLPPRLDAPELSYCQYQMLNVHIIGEVAEHTLSYALAAPARRSIIDCVPVAYSEGSSRHCASERAIHTAASMNFAHLSSDLACKLGCSLMNAYIFEHWRGVSICCVIAMVYHFSQHNLEWFGVASAWMNSVNSGCAVYYPHLFYNLWATLDTEEEAERYAIALTPIPDPAYQGPIATCLCRTNTFTNK